MKGKRFEVFTISAEAGSVTAFRGRCKVLPPTDFRKLVNGFMGPHSVLFPDELLFVY